MCTELRNDFGEVYLTLEYNSINQWVYTNWIGPQTYRQVTWGADACLAKLKEHHCSFLLNDNRGVTGTWDFAVDWVISSWAPRAIEQGLTHMAHINSPDSLTIATAKTMYDAIGTDLHLRIFSTLEEASTWLRRAHRRKVLS